MSKLKNKKILIPIVLLIVLGGAYKFVLAKPEAKAKPPKVEGTVYVLGKEFLLNLSDGRFAKLSAALVLDPLDHSIPAAGGHGAAATPPEGYGAMAQEGLIRAIITDEVTNAEDEDLISSAGRKRLKKEILHRIHEETDVEADDVLFTDITVQ